MAAEAVGVRLPLHAPPPERPRFRPRPFFVRALTVGQPIHEPDPPTRLRRHGRTAPAPAKPVARASPRRAPDAGRRPSPAAARRERSDRGRPPHVQRGRGRAPALKQVEARCCTTGPPRQSRRWACTTPLVGSTCRRPAVQPGDDAAFGEAHRRFQCRRCGRQVVLRRSGDQGHIDCGPRCRTARRRESRRRAGRRYQATPRSRAMHAARQQRYLERRAAKMTHQASAPPPQAGATGHGPTTTMSTRGPEPPEENRPCRTRPARPARPAAPAPPEPARCSRPPPGCAESPCPREPRRDATAPGAHPVEPAPGSRP